MRASILVVDDEPDIRDVLREFLEQERYRVVTAATGEEAVRRLEAEAFDVVLTDIVMPGIDGLEVLRQARSLAPWAPVVFITAYGSLDTAVEAFRCGAADYFLKPLRIDDLVVRLRQLLNQALVARPAACAAPAVTLVGGSLAIQTVRSQIARVAPTCSDVLVSGETGTGKELVAHAIHARSARPGRLIAINCSAIPADLFESTLFGHVKGAFTNAVQANPGLVRLADRGTLFLDEVGEMPLALQAKLLRVVEQKEVWPVGAAASERVDCRIVASTNRHLRRDVEAGRFREDLFYRLSVVRIALPPLHERREDIPLLVEHFIRRLNAKLGMRVVGIEPAALRALTDARWAGNVRELLHVVESAMIAGARGDTIALEDFPVDLVSFASPRSLKDAARDFERRQILDVLAGAAFDKREAARRLGLSLASLYRKLDGKTT